MLWMIWYDMKRKKKKRIDGRRLRFRVTRLMDDNNDDDAWMQARHLF